MNTDFRKKTSSLLMNNKVIMGISVFLSFVIWLWVSVEKSPIETTVIKDVPVSIELENSVPSQLGLQVFGESNYTVDVKVTGKKFILQTLTADKITVTAQTNYVDGAGTKSLALKADVRADCDVVSLSDNYIDVFFDTLAEKEFTIEPVVNTTAESIVEKSLMLGSVVLSNSTVKVSGPSSEINAVSGVKAIVNLTKQLSATETFTPELSIAGASAKNHLTLSVKANELTMTVPVLKVVTLDTTVTFKNTPTSYINAPLAFSVTPSKLTVAIPVEKVDTIKNVSVATIDFSSVNKGYNNFSFKTSEITEYKVISDVSTVRVVINANGKSSETYSIPAQNVSVTDQNEGFTSTVKQKGIENITIIGSTDDLKQLSNNDIYAEIDLSNQPLKAGENKVEATIVVKGNGACWAYGKYEVTVIAVAK